MLCYDTQRNARVPESAAPGGAGAEAGGGIRLWNPQTLRASRAYLPNLKITNS